MRSKYSEHLASALKDARASDVIINEANKVLLTLPLKEKKIVINGLRSFTVQEFVNGKYRIFEKFFRVKKGNDISAAGIGHGEVMCLMGIKNSTTSGLFHGDVKINKRILEVKQLTKSKHFRLGYSGNLNNSDLMFHIVLFYNILSTARIANPEIQEILDKYFIFNNCYETVQKFFEIGKMKINAMYQGFRVLNKYLKNFDSEYAVCKIHDKEFVIPIESYEEIINSDFPTTINLPIIRDVTKHDSHISIKKISEHPYVINPHLLIEDITVITQLFCHSVDLLLLFDEEGDIVNMCSTNKYNPLCVSRITQGTFKMQYLPDDSHYQFLEHQKKHLKNIQS